MKTPSRSNAPRRGFALVVALSLMILLTVIAVGLLTLAGVSLRSASQGEAMAIARSNARMALILALGELQKSAGPDQRITAPASLPDSQASPAITGVWESWKPSATGEDYDGRKKTAQTTPETPDGEFVTWLASGDPKESVSPVKTPGAAAAATNLATLVSDRVAGTETIRGVHLSPTRVNQRGELAWSVIDEGVKARIDLPTENKPTDARERLARLRAPARPQPEAIGKQFEGLRMDEANAFKLVSLNQGELGLGTKNELRPYLHDLTPHSASLPVNVAEGGFKADLTRAFESTTLPGDLATRYIYSNDKTRSTPSDPKFSTLASYYQLYKQYKSSTTPLQISAPRAYSPIRGTTPNLNALDGTLVAPVVTKVSVVFSLASRLAHGNWQTSVPGTSGDPQRTNMVYLIYTPVITVYNPYSMPIQFADLKVTFKNLPVAFKFFRNGLAQNVNHTLLSTFHISSDNANPFDDPFSSTVSNNPGSASSSMITLYPGEARVFGTSHQPTTTWGSMVNYLWQNDLDQSKTKNVFSGAGWDYRSGYIVDWLRPAIAGRTADNASLGVFGVRPNDNVNVEVTPIMPGGSGGKFTVEFSAQVNRRVTPLGIYEYNYGNQSKLTEVLSKGNHTTIGKVSFPFRVEKDIPVPTMTLSNPDNTPIRNWGSTPKQFAIFTLGTRTATDSLYPGKPGKTSSFVHHILQMDATRTHPALLPMEMSLLPIRNAGANTVGSIEADDANRAFHFSGTSRLTGAIQYVSQNLPKSPLLNLADFRHANLASSGHLPLVQHTVGESLASPMVPGDKTLSATSPFGYQVADHAWLANQTLWDNYFLSGITDPAEATKVFEPESSATTGRLLNPRLAPLVPPGTDAKSAITTATGPDAWADLASMLAIKGGFNVNSTSKNAWKAVLSSLRGLEVPVLGPVEIRDPAVNPATLKESISSAQQSAFPRLSRPISGRVDRTNSSDNQRRWSGYRELDDKEIDKLATAIVEEVRTRGPFLSMAEFVNRRVSSSGDDKAARGALEEALRKSAINDIPMPAGREITEAEASGFGYANPKAAAGNTEEGASAILSQGDLLSAIGASVTVRSDTFVIRTYGAAREGNRITATARCEAVVQRVPSFVDPTDEPSKVQPAVSGGDRKITSLSAVNQRFGRRFQVVSFRWLAANEV